MRVVSLFSGCGGLDLGFQRANHKIVWANDLFEDAIETYKKNIGGHITSKGIEEIASSEIPRCDIVIGGFPCQGFSVANWKRTITDRRNQLYQQMVRVISDLQPKYFIGENVRGLATMGGGQALDAIISDFEKATPGYDVEYAILNSADFGVPQKRYRLIIFGKRKDLKRKIKFPPTPTHSNPELDTLGIFKPWVSVGEALDGLPDPDKKNKLKNHTYSQYKLRFNGYIGHRWVDPEKPAPTVTARGDDKGGVVVIHHPNNKRRMTARELAVVQSFPVDFEFHGARSSVYRQIANAVPPLLAKAIGEMFNR